MARARIVQPTGCVDGSAGQPTVPGLPCGLMHVVFLALLPGPLAATVEDIECVLAHGGRVTLVVGDPRAWGQLDDRVDAVDLSSAEHRYWLRRAEQFILYGIPDMPLRLLRQVLDVCARCTYTPVGRHMTRMAEAVDRRRSHVHTSANRLHDRLFLPHYRTVRPWVLWRVARRGLLSDHDFSDADQIVVADDLSTALGWHLARRLPHVNFGFSLDQRLTSEHVAQPRPNSDA